MSTESIPGLPPSRRLWDEVTRFGRYSLVGTAGTVTDLIVTIGMVKLIGISPYAANVCGFLVAVVQNFILNRWLTFPESRRSRVDHQMAKFGLVSIVGLAINVPVFWLVDAVFRPYWVQALKQSGTDASYLFAKLCVIGVVLVWNFMANRFWTFRSA